MEINYFQIQFKQKIFRNISICCCKSCLSSGFRKVMLVFPGARFTYYLVYDLFWRYIDRTIHVEVEFPEYTWIFNGLV